eukprot:s574_g8.t1
MPVRTPQFLDGVPGNSMEQQWAVQESSTVHDRARLLLSALSRNGLLILEIRQQADILTLGLSCNHGPNSHELVVGVRLPDGTFRSRLTAEYPPELASALAGIIKNFTTLGGRVADLDLASWRSWVAFPFDVAQSLLPCGRWWWLPEHCALFWGAVHSTMAFTAQEVVPSTCTSKDCLRIVVHLASGCPSAPLTEEALQPYFDDLLVAFDAQHHSEHLRHVAPGVEELRSKCDHVAIGKLGVVIAEGRSPRLVVDSSVSNVTSNASIPNHTLLPKISDLMRCTPLGMASEQITQLTLDVSKAHRKESSFERFPVNLGPTPVAHQCLAPSPPPAHPIVPYIAEHTSDNGRRQPCQRVTELVDDSLVLTTSMTSQHHSLAAGACIRRVANTFVTDREGLKSVHTKRVWLGITVSPHRLLDDDAVAALHAWREILSSASFCISMIAPQFLPVQATADANGIFERGWNWWCSILLRWLLCLVYADITHIPGHLNVLADALSRYEATPVQLDPSSQVGIDWKSLMCQNGISVVQPDAKWPSTFRVRLAWLENLLAESRAYFWGLVCRLVDIRFVLGVSSSYR